MKSDSGDIGDNVFEHAGHRDICGYVDGNYIGTLLFDVDVYNVDVFGHVSVGSGSNGDVDCNNVLWTCW